MQSSRTCLLRFGISETRCVFRFVSGLAESRFGVGIPAVRASASAAATAEVVLAPDGKIREAQRSRRPFGSGRSRGERSWIGAGRVASAAEALALASAAEKLEPVVCWWEVWS